MRAATFGMAMGLSALLAACGPGAAPPAGPPGGMPLAEVGVVTVAPGDIGLFTELPGRLEASRVAQVRARAAGILQKQLFREGSDVKAGQALFEIDASPYQATYASAQASLARAEANLMQARAQAERYKPLVEAQAVSQQEFVNAQAAQKQAEADVATGKAAVQTARINLAYASVTAPISGRVGAAMITTGNLVDPSALLTTMVSLDPINVYFEGDERTFLRYQELIRDGARPSARSGGNPVRVGLTSEVGFPHEGVLDFVDNQLDPATGTIRVRARLPNADRRFTPGLFARVTLELGSRDDALLVPEQAMWPQGDKQFVYVVKGGKAETRGDFVAIPNRLSLRAGGFFETKGQDDAYLNIDFHNSEKGGVSLGGTVRLGPVDVSAAYQHTFYGTLDNKGNGSVTALSGDGAGCPKGQENPSPAPGCFRSQQAINGGSYSSALNEVALGADFRF